MADVSQLLAQYHDIIQQLKQLEDEKTSLREEIRELVQRAGCPVSTMIGDTRVNARVVTSVKVDYDEAGLRERLGDRFRSILVVDAKKVRRHLDELQPVLEPYLDTLGSVSQERVAEQITTGRMSSSEFAGLFKKEHKSTLYVQMQSASSATQAEG
jgi:uncharacterized protein (UPF0335 family)